MVQYKSQSKFKKNIMTNRDRDDNGNDYNIMINDNESQGPKEKSNS
jgi:hypothetical protein